MATQKTYDGNCHCGAYRFQLRLPDIESAVTCNCSLCRKGGCLWAFPEDGDFWMTRGEGTEQGVYQSSIGETRFCRSCGTILVGRHTGGPLASKFGVNLRTLLGVNPFLLKLEESSSKNDQWETPPYAINPFLGTLPDFPGDDIKTYTGSCHCGLITVALKSKPLLDVDIKEDNCSICVRNAWVGIYPRKAQVAISGAENATDYLWGRKFGSQSFCKVCGVVVFQKLFGPPKEVVDKWPPARQEVYRRNMDMMPVNIRMLDGVDLKELKIASNDVGTEGYALDP